MRQLVDHNGSAPRACPVCDAGSGVALATLRYALFDDLCMSGEKRLAGCRRCGMLYDDVALTERQLAEYYGKNEHYAVSSTGGTGGISEDNATRYGRILSVLSPERDGVILDVGCGQGGFVDHCRAKGLAAVGVEPSQRSRAAASNLGLPVFPSLDAFRAAHSEKPVAAVVLSHVLEHLLRPLDLLRRMAQMAPGAKVYVEVPDAASYLAPGAVRWQELYFEHLAHFRSKNLTDIARLAGIRPRNAGTCSFSPAQSETHCCFVVGVVDGTVEPVTAPAFAEGSHIERLPPVPEVVLPGRGNPLALWGVSQYAMLLLGSRPELVGVSRLFDASPAKIGRTIGGVLVEAPDALATLPADAMLLLPQSPYTTRMIEHLATIGFKGTWITV